MYVLPQDSKLAQLLERVSSNPPGTPFVLASPTGQANFLGTRLSNAGVSEPQGLARACGLALLQAFVSPFAVIGLPATESIALLNACGVSNMNTLSAPKVPSQAYPTTSAFDDVFAKLKQAQEARKLNPGKPPETLKLGGMTFTLYDNITLMGKGLTLRGDVVVSTPKDVAVSEHKTSDALPSSTSYRSLIGDPQKANDLVNYLGDSVDLFSSAFPDLAKQTAVAGDIIDAFAIVTSGVGMLDAIHQKDNNALVGYSLTLGAGALGLLSDFSSNSTLRSVAIFLKFSKGGWAYWLSRQAPGHDLRLT